MQKREKHQWSRDELSRVLDLYSDVRDSIHESNQKIIALASLLNVGVRAVEAQLLMFRALDRGKYTWDRMGKVNRELWDARNKTTHFKSNASASGLTLQSLQFRSFGGERVAAQPDAADESWWPSGPTHAGVDALITAVAKATEATNPGLIGFFLLGGAGNGKSFAARKLLTLLGMPPPPAHGKLAERCYSIRIGAAELVILNDATIASRVDYGDKQSTALAADLASWCEKAKKSPIILLCCINRGIIIDEMRHLENVKRSTEIGILHWLSFGSIGPLQEAGCRVESPEPASHGRYRRLVATRSTEISIELHALAVDAGSLVEPHWEVSDLGEMEKSGVTAPTTSQVEDLPMRSKAPAAQLFRSVLTALAAEAAVRPARCPVRANVEQLLGSVELWTSVMRSCEIANGRLLSYRDIWGLIGLSIIGPRAPGAIVAHVDSLIARMDSPDRLERLEVLLALSAHRCHQALFRAPRIGDDSKTRTAAGFPAAHGLGLVDPSATRAKYSREVESAMSGVPLNQRPSDELCRELPRFKEAWSEFDRELEATVLEAVHALECPEPRRRQLVAWLGGYLQRAAGLCTGELGQSHVLKAWQRCRNVCAIGPAALPQDLEVAIRALLFPVNVATGASRVFVRAFSPRMDPVHDLDENRGALLESVDPTPIALRIARRGEVLALEVYQAASQSAPIAETTLDFPLIREALLWHEGQSGATERTRDIEPRLERVRSASFNRLQRRLGVVHDHSVEELT